MIDKFEHYLALGKVKQKTADKVEADSLLENAEKRIKYLRELNKETANLVLEDAYESARESAQALMSLKGYKPYSHEATISFVRDQYAKDFDEYEISLFDRFRILKTNSVYRAEKISEDDAVKCAEFAKSFVRKVKNIMKAEMKQAKEDQTQ